MQLQFDSFLGPRFGHIGSGRKVECQIFDSRQKLQRIRRLKGSLRRGMRLMSRTVSLVTVQIQ